MELIGTLCSIPDNMCATDIVNKYRFQIVMEWLHSSGCNMGIWLINLSTIVSVYKVLFNITNKRLLQSVWTLWRRNEEKDHYSEHKIKKKPHKS